MRYSELVEIYEKIAGTTKKLEKTKIIAEFLPRLKGHEEWIYLLRGRVFADYDSRELGISTQLVIKAIAQATGASNTKVVEMFTKQGDLGDVASILVQHKKQAPLISRELSVEHVLNSLRAVCVIEGKGAVDKKMSIVSELISSSSPEEAKYLMRTLIGDLRVGVADAILLDAIVETFFAGENEMHEKVEYASDLINDFAEILKLAFKGKQAFSHINFEAGRPVKVMLPVKVTEISEAFRICGKPVAVEHKYDGFRMIITSNGKEIKLFTRRLEDVTKQFPDVVSCIKQHVKAKEFILDSEVVGYDKDKKRYTPFEAISQRIKRKYDIEKLIEKLPVEVNVFDVLYADGKEILERPFSKRREILEGLIVPKQWIIRLSRQIVTSDEKEVEKFYKNALKIGEEGIMFKKLDAPYRPGRRVGYMVKLKPEVADLDLVIVGAEYGTGKRSGGLTSFIVACKSNGEFLEVGRVSSGLKEKEGEGTTYKELDKILQKIVIKENGNSVIVKPKVIVSVTYQNVQHSPSYSSGFALRFPRITHYRPERGTGDIATLEDIKREVARGQRMRNGGEG